MMKNIKEVKTWTPEEREEQIRIRQQLIHSMVGQLYPRILWDEIAEIKEEKWKEWLQHEV